MSQEQISFPEEYDRRKLNALYREIPLKDTTSRLLRKYFNAMAGLYGIIPLKKAWEIIHSQCQRAITEREFLAFAEIARHECEYFYILGDDELYVDGKLTDPFQREIICVEMFGMVEDLYFLTKKNQQGKPYYIPDKQELLRYADPFYVELTPEAENLRDFCINELKMDEREAGLFILTMDDKIRFLNPNPTDWLPDWEKMGISFVNEKQLNDFLNRCQAMYNNGRMQCNRGHTPKEMWEMCPAEHRIPKALRFGPNIRKSIADGTMDADEMRAQIFSMKLPSEELRLDMLRQIDEIESKNRPKTISRNAPCPCGSGRKYKNCCGRK